ncbi:hypothetical protein LTR17_002624 [Elasticomyces elasticus]|nr:hypothetical protein LTR17_002624 [Elasticomyces elasticus]
MAHEFQLSFREAFAVYKETSATAYSYAPQPPVKRRYKTTFVDEPKLRHTLEPEKDEDTDSDQENIDPADSKGKKPQRKRVRNTKDQSHDDKDDEGVEFNVDAAETQRKTDEWRARVDDVIKETLEDDVQGSDGVELDEQLDATSAASTEAAPMTIEELRVLFTSNGMHEFLDHIHARRRYALHTGQRFPKAGSLLYTDLATGRKLDSVSIVQTDAGCSSTCTARS